jgi:hypothetical protein
VVNVGDYAKVADVLHSRRSVVLNEVQK